jgi:hypothetical protein
MAVAPARAPAARLGRGAEPAKGWAAGLLNEHGMGVCSNGRVRHRPQSVVVESGSSAWTRSDVPPATQFEPEARDPRVRFDLRKSHLYVPGITRE